MKINWLVLGLCMGFAFLGTFVTTWTGSNLLGVLVIAGAVLLMFVLSERGTGGKALEVT